MSSPDAVDSAFPWLYGYDIVRELPHQADAFTQGLEYDKRCTKTVKGDGFECVDIFWESTGEHLQLLVASETRVACPTPSVFFGCPLPPCLRKFALNGSPSSSCCVIMSAFVLSRDGHLPGKPIGVLRGPQKFALCCFSDGM